MTETLAQIPIDPIKEHILPYFKMGFQVISIAKRTRCKIEKLFKHLHCFIHRSFTYIKISIVIYIGSSFMD